MSEESVRHFEPRWPAALALLSLGALYYALPSALTVGPDWLVLVLVAALAIPAMIFHRQGNWRLSQLLGYAASSFVTLSVAISLVLLIWRLPGHTETPAMDLDFVWQLRQALPPPPRGVVQPQSSLAGGARILFQRVCRTCRCDRSPRDGYGGR